jgi:hypothetical protein
LLSNILLAIIYPCVDDNTVKKLPGWPPCFHLATLCRSFGLYLFDLLDPFQGYGDRPAVQLLHC